MKKAILIIVPLILTISTTTGFVFSRMTQTMQLRINAKDLPEQSLVIIKPSDPAFNDIASELLQGVPNEEVEIMRPLSILIKNTGNKTVVAYTIIWEGVEATGQKQSYVITHANSEALTDGEEYFKALPRTNLDRTIKPGTIRLFSLLPLPSNRNNSGGGGFGGRQQEQNQLEQNPQEIIEAGRGKTIQRYGAQLLAQYTELTVSIDGVFFDDGTFAGPDSSGFFDRMKAQVDAKRDLRKSILENLRRGKSHKEIFDEIEAKTRAGAAVTNLIKNSTPADYYSFFSKFFATQFLQLRALHGDDNALDKALGSRNKPELVLRKPNSQQ